MNAHQLEIISRTGSLPVNKVETHTIPKDAMLSASILAADVMAECINGQKPWQGFANRVRHLPPEGRGAFLMLLKKAKSARVKANAEIMGTVGKDGTVEVSKDQKKMAGVLDASATVYLSKLRRIAEAWNKGATDDGLVMYVRERNKVLPSQELRADDISWHLASEYSEPFVAKSNAGAPKKAWLEKLTKFLETTKPDEDAPEELQAYAAVVTKVNELKGSTPAV